MAQKRKKNKKWVYWVIMAVLFVVAGVVTYLVCVNYFADKKGEEEQNTEEVEEKKDENEKKDDEKDEAEKAVEAKKVEQYEGSDPNKMEELSGAITYTGLSGDVLMVRVNIDQYLDGGTCELRLVQGGDVAYNNIVEIVGGAATSSCAGFDIPVSGLSGDYEVVVKLNSGEKTGVIRGEAGV